MTKKRGKTPLKQQLVSALESYEYFLSKADTREKARLDRKLRAYNLELSIYDAINLLNDLESV
jgi:hypothetical protein